MNVLVTGGAGYIGSHACKLLAARGHVPVTYDNLSRGHRGAVKWGPCEVGDMEDRAKLRSVFDRYQPEAVMHFAAFAYVGESVEQPLLYYRNNVAGSHALLQTVVECGVRPIIFSSSCVTYGIPSTIPIGEDHPQHPINPYGHSKLFVERMLADAGTAHGLRSVSLRYFNAAGADPDGQLGEDHAPEIHVIPRSLAAAQNGTPIDIFGEDYPTPDGTCLRDYVHVMDLADAHVRALQRLESGGASAFYNVGTERPSSVRDVVAAVERVTGKTVERRSSPRREGDPAVLFASAEKIRSELGWRPQRAELDTIVADAWKWHSTHPAGYDGPVTSRPGSGQS